MLAPPDERANLSRIHRHAAMNPHYADLPQSLDRYMKRLSNSNLTIVGHDARYVALRPGHDDVVAIDEGCRRAVAKSDAIAVDHEHARLASTLESRCGLPGH